MNKRLLLLLLSLLLGACNLQNNDENGENGDAANDPAALVQSAAEQLEEANSFQLTLAVEGKPVVLDVSALQEGATLNFQQATADFVKPDRIQANVQVTFQDVPTEIQLRAIGDEQFVRHQVLTLNQWMQETLVSGFNPTALVSADSGIANAVRSLQNPSYVEATEVDGIEVHHVRGQLEAPLVQALTVGLIGTREGTLEADLYIRSNNGNVEQLVLREPLADGQTEATVWTIGIYNYNGDFNIERPDTD